MRLWQKEDTISRRDHQAMVDILTDQIDKGHQREAALRELTESLTLTAIQRGQSGNTTERLVRKGPDAVKSAILEKAGGDLKLARYLSEWAMKERLKGEKGEDELISDLLNWAPVDDSSDDAMPQ